MLSSVLIIILMASVPLMVFAQDDSTEQPTFFATNTPNPNVTTATTSPTETPQDSTNDTDEGEPVVFAHRAVAARDAASQGLVRKRNVGLRRGIVFRPRQRRRAFNKRENQICFKVVALFL